MNRNEAIKKLGDIIDYYWIEIEEKGLGDEITEVIEALEKEATLADLLGWKENVEYAYYYSVYKVVDGKLYHRYGYGDNFEWELVDYTISYLHNLQHAIKS